MKPNREFFEKRIGGSFHYQNIWGDLYAMQIRKRFVDKYIKPNFKSVVDFGCGNGRWLFYLKTRGASHVLGVEQSYLLAHNCVVKCLSCGVQSVKLQNIRKKFDYVIGITSFNFILPKDRFKVITNAKHLLAKNGQLLILDYLPNSVPEYQRNLDYKEVWTYTKWADLCRQYRLKLVKVVPVNFVDTTLFHYFGFNVFTYWLTYIADVCFTGIVNDLFGFAKYRLLIFEND